MTTAIIIIALLGILDVMLFLACAELEKRNGDERRRR